MSLERVERNSEYARRDASHRVCSGRSTTLVQNELSSLVNTKKNNVADLKQSIHHNLPKGNDQLSLMSELWGHGLQDFGRQLHRPAEWSGMCDFSWVHGSQGQGIRK